jgi:V/A-type H+-transporting ATPase subunit C
MTNAANEHVVMDFYRYPPIGVEQWRYAFATAKVRVLETTMISRGTFADMANAGSFEEAVELLSGTEYTVGTKTAGVANIEKMLLERRSEARRLFMDLMLDKELVELLRAREDFANMRLAIRRVVTGRPIGLEYSDEGSVPAEEFEEIFEQENYSRFPEYLQEGVEEAVLGYYENKDIRMIDYGIDRVQAQYRIRRAKEIGCAFCLSYFRTQIDLTNIRTLVRLKMAERDDRDLFLPGGFIEIGRLVHGLDLGNEALGALFYSTPYHEVVERGLSYLSQEKSFLGLERECQEHITGFLKTASVIAAGPQPVIAYFLMKENEIRTVRMVLTAKLNGLDSKIILDRLGG